MGLRFAFAAAISAGVLIGVARADVVTLQDGTRLDGSVKREPGGWVITDSAGKVSHVTDSQIKGIDKVVALSPEEAAMAKLASLRKAAEPLADAKAALDRYQRFVDQNKESPAAVAEAKKDMVVWQDRVDRKLVRVGAGWMTPEEQAAAIQKSVVLVDQAREQYKQGKLKDAGATASQILQLDANHVSGLYLKALVDYKMETSPGPAKRGFERIREIIPDHGPCLNNSAVILVQQKQATAALPLMEQAMLGSPVNRTILDNAAELLNGIPDEQRNNSNYRKLERRFADQDQELGRELAKQGLVRWGSTWVSQDKYEEVKKDQARITAKLDALAEEFNRMTRRMDEIDREIDQTQNDQSRLDTGTTYLDASGRPVYVPGNNARYIELGRIINRLKEERNSLRDRKTEFPARAAKIRQETPSPPYAGQLRMIETEGTPLPQAMLPDSPRAEAPKGDGPRVEVPAGAPRKGTEPSVAPPLEPAPKVPPTTRPTSAGGIPIR